MSNKKLQRLARWLPVLSLLAIVGIGLFALRVQAPFNEHLRRAVVWEVSRAVNGKVRLGECRLELLPSESASGRRAQPVRLRLSLLDLIITEMEAADKGDQVEALIRLPETYIDINLGRLFSGGGLSDCLHEITVNQPRLRLVRDAQGRWNFRDLLISKPGRPTYFSTRIDVVDGRVSLNDFSPPEGLESPQQNNLNRIDLTVFVERAPKEGERPAVLKVDGRLSGSAVEQCIGDFLLTVSSVTRYSESNRAVKTDTSGSIVVPQVDLGYLWRYGAISSVVGLEQGRGDVTGYFRHDKGISGPPALDYALCVAGRDIALDLPWVRGKVEELEGTGRFANGVFQFENLRGRVAETSLQGEGCLVSRASQAAGEENELAYAFQVMADKARLPALAAIIPAELPKEIRQQQGVLKAQVNILGQGEAYALHGRLSSPRLKVKATLPVVAESDTPTHISGVKSEFIYSRQRMAIAGSGAVSGGKVRAAVLVPAAGRVQFAGSVEDLDLPMMRLSKQAQAGGDLWANLRGSLPIAGGAEAADVSPAVGGDITLQDGILHTSIGDHSAEIGLQQVGAQFAYAERYLYISRAAAATDHGAVKLAGSIKPSGEVQANIEAEAIDLRRIGEAAGRDFRGTAFLSADLAGTRQRPRMALHGDLFSAGMGGFDCDWIGGELTLEDKKIPAFEIVFQRGGGEGRLKGEATLPGKEDPGRIAAEGTLAKAKLSEWLPEEMRSRVKGIIEAEVRISGSPQAPNIGADFFVTRPWLTGMQFDTAEGTLQYSNGSLALPQFTARVNGAYVSAVGEASSDGELDFDITGERLRLASLLQSQPNIDADGWVSLTGEMRGRREAPRLSAQIAAEQVTLRQRPVGDISADIDWDGNKVEINDLTLKARGGHVRVAGRATKDAKASEEAARPINLELEADFAGMEIGFLVDLTQRGLQILPAEQSRRPLSIMRKVPRPIRGYLTADVDISGPLNSPAARADFAVSEASLAGQHLPYLEGTIEASRERLALDSVTVREGDALATATGEIVFAGDTQLDVDIHNLNAEVLRPWVRNVSGLGGSADAYLLVAGPTKAPIVRGDMEIANPVVGGVALERLKIDRFLLTRQEIDIENLRLVKGPHLARLSAALPFSWQQGKLEAGAPLLLEGTMQKQDLGFITELWPELGEFAGPLDTYFKIAGTTSEPRLESGHIHTSGQWSKRDRQAQIELHAEVVDGVLLIQQESGNGGLNVMLEEIRDDRVRKIGEVVGAGFYEPFAGGRSRWGYGRYRLDLAAENLDLEIADTADVRLNGDLVLRGGPESEDEIAGEIIVLRGDATAPTGGTGEGFSWRPRFSPRLDVGVKVQRLDISTLAARVEMFGEGRIGGHLGYEPLGLDFLLKAKRGLLDFPAAVAEVQKLEIAATKEPEAELVVTLQMEATARVGRYRVDLSGGGRLLPPGEELRITSSSTPPLAEDEATALLLGIPPSALAGARTGEETLGQNVSESLSSSVTTIAATGLTAPLLKSIGLNELSFATSPVSSRMTLGKRFGKQIYFYYLSTLGGPNGSSIFRIIYDVTRDLSLGVSVNELDQETYELQTIKTF